MEKQEEYLVDQIFLDLDKKTDEEIRELELNGSEQIKFIIQLWKEQRRK